MCSLSVSQREFDENEVDPYHGKDRRPEPEAMDLPEDLNLDQEDEAEDDGEGESEGETCSRIYGGRLFIHVFKVFSELSLKFRKIKADFLVFILQRRIHSTSTKKLWMWMETRMDKKMVGRRSKEQRR